MIADRVKARVQAAFAGATVAAEGDEGRMVVTVVSDAFCSLPRVKKQQLVYQTIADLIAAGELHAVTIRALTPDEVGAS